MAKRESAFANILRQLFEAEEFPVGLLRRLSDMTPEEWDQFVVVWPTVDDNRRHMVVRHLADLTEEAYDVEFSPVFRVCLEDVNSNVRLAALDGLWDSTNTTVVPLIIAMMSHDADVEVRRAAAATLGHYVLLGEWGQIAAKVRDRIVEALLKVHRDPRTAQPVRRATLEALAPSADPAVPGLITAAFESDDSGMQLSAIYAMGQSADTRWLPTLLDEMINPWEDMRAEAARAAGELGSGDAIDQLAELAYDDVADVQLAAIQALGRIGGDRAAHILHEMQEDAELAELADDIGEALDELEMFNSDFDLSRIDWDYDDDAA